MPGPSGGSNPDRPHDNQTCYPLHYRASRGKESIFLICKCEMPTKRNIARQSLFTSDKPMEDNKYVLLDEIFTGTEVYKCPSYHITYIVNMALHKNVGNQVKTQYK